jgi:hypothetical protein
MEPAVEPARAEQLLMTTPLDDAAGLENDNLIGMADGSEPVGDDQDRSVLHEPLDRLLHQPLRLGIQRAGGFI